MGVLSWNGFPKHTRNKLTKKHQSDYESNKELSTLDENIQCLCMKIPYMGAEGDKLCTKLKKKTKTTSFSKIEHTDFLYE